MNQETPTGEAGRGLGAAPCSAIPRASQEESEIGWTVSYGTLERIADEVNSKSDDGGVSLETVELTLLTAVKCGYATLSPNDKSSNVPPKT